MKKPKNPPLTFTEFLKIKADIPPQGPPEALDEALGELANFAKWDDGVLEGMKADTAFMGQIAALCSDLCMDLRRERAVPMQTHRQTQKISAALADAVRLLNDNSWATMKVMLHYDSPEDTLVIEFCKALEHLAKLQNAAARAEATKEPVVRKFFGRTSSNMAHLIFLARCRDCMMIFGRRKVPLRKSEGALLRFARPLYRYATGLKVEYGSFDRQIDDLIVYSRTPTKRDSSERSSGSTGRSATGTGKKNAGMARRA